MMPFKKGGLSAQVAIGAFIHFSSRLASVVMGVVLARGLGVEAYGVYSYALALMGLAILVVEFGLPTALLRRVTSDHVNENWSAVRFWVLMGPVVVLSTGAAIGVVGATFAWVTMFGDERSAALLAFVLLPLTAVTRVLAAILKGVGRNALAQFFELLFTQLIVLSLTAALFAVSEDFRRPEAAIVVLIFATIMTIVPLIFLVQRGLPRGATEQVQQPDVASLIKGSLPFAVVNAALFVNTQIDVLVVGWFRSAEEVGLYRVAAQAGLLAAFGNQVMAVVATPVFARLFAKNDLRRLRHVYTRSRIVTFATALAVTTAFLAFGSILLPWIFGAEYAQSYLPMAILCCGYTVNAAFGPAGSLLAMTGFEKSMSRILVSTAFLCFVLSIGLVSQFGLPGAASATAISVSLYHFLFWRTAERKLWK